MQVQNLNFSYHTEEGADMHLHEVALTIKRGQKVALVGESGSGKTTLLKVMRDLYDPQHIQVHLDKKLLPAGFKSISKDIALIPQDPEIFATTILENITLGIKYPLVYVKRFTDMANFTEVAERLPRKFDSSIVEKGVNLSGGEKQRLALARGLLAGLNKELLLLDEPTSSVDTKNELLIYKNIFKKFRKKTILSSIHRLHLLPLFDQIVYFKEGRIVAAGSFRQLLKNAEFKRVWKTYQQAQKN